jgi:hypothetical protein
MPVDIARTLREALVRFSVTRSDSPARWLRSERRLLALAVIGG